MAKDEIVETKESEAKKKFREVIEAYKIQNPVKYTQKKARLEAKLATL